MVRQKGRKHQELLELLKDKIPNGLLPKIPHRWWFIGDILIATIPDSLNAFQKAIGEAFLAIHSERCRTVLGKVGPTKGITREPSFQYLAGDKETETIHKELGCQFALDAAKITFSPGNHSERKRLMEVTSFGEIIIDMFTCVGNLSLPLAVHNEPIKVIGAEINPLAFRYLEKNILLNKVTDNMKGVLGDNRIVLQSFKQQADRVLMGYLFCDQQQLLCAINLCKSGGIIHYHEGTPQKVKNRPVRRIKQATKKVGRGVEILHKRSIKSYAPGVDHLVIDAKIS
jgi:tRNA wybutosine-synthesizing protein 2